MTPDAAIGVLRIMKDSYTGIAEDKNLTPGRRGQAANRLKAIDTAIVALARVEEADASRTNTG